MQDNNDQLHAGSVGNQEADAGRVQELGEVVQATTPTPAVSDSTGCASQSTADKDATQAVPPQTLREFERALRMLGFTRLQAASIARKGFSGATAVATPEPEPVPREPDQLRAALQRLAQTLKVEP